MDSPPLIVKAPCFYSWVRTDARWPSPLVDSQPPAGLPGLMGNTNQRALPDLLGLLSDSEVRQGAEKEANQNSHQRQQECWVLRSLSRAWVIRDHSVPFLAFHTRMEPGPSYKTSIQKQQRLLKSSKSANTSPVLMSPEFLSCMHFS